MMLPRPPRAVELLIEAAHARSDLIQAGRDTDPRAIAAEVVAKLAQDLLAEGEAWHAMRRGITDSPMLTRIEAASALAMIGLLEAAVRHWAGITLPRQS